MVVYCLHLRISIESTFRTDVTVIIIMLHCGVLYCRRVSLALRNRCYLITFFKHAWGSPAWSHHPLVCLSLLTNHFLSSPTHTLSSTFLCIKISIIKICSKSVDTPPIQTLKCLLCYVPDLRSSISSVLSCHSHSVLSSTVSWHRQFLFDNLTSLHYRSIYYSILRYLVTNYKKIFPLLSVLSCNPDSFLKSHPHYLAICFTLTSTLKIIHINLLFPISCKLSTCSCHLYIIFILLLSVLSCHPNSLRNYPLYLAIFIILPLHCLQTSVIIPRLWQF